MSNTKDMNVLVKEKKGLALTFTGSDEAQFKQQHSSEFFFVIKHELEVCSILRIHKYCYS